ncbi:hypothetical protein F7725_007513, partial [Dissostichus mawsoni]
SVKGRGAFHCRTRQSYEVEIDCVCSFKTQVALKNHLLKHETVTLRPQDAVAHDNIQRVRIESLPETVDELKTILKNHLTLEGEMVIQFQDPEFNNEFCNLTDISELPREMLKLKIIMSDYTLDTGSLDTSSGSSGEMSGRSKHWPDPFTIPSFSYDIELKLRRGN